MTIIIAALLFVAAAAIGLWVWLPRIAAALDHLAATADQGRDNWAGDV